MSNEGKIKKVIKEYFERMIKSHTTREGVTTDRNIDCPNPICRCTRAIFWSGGLRGYWNKCHRCGFNFPKELTPPGPEELEEVFEARDKERRTNEIIGKIKELGITI